MDTKAKLQSYEAVKFSITITAPVEDWRSALKQLGKLKEGAWVAWPLCGFVGCIDKMLSDLDRTHADVLVKLDATGTHSE